MHPSEIFSRFFDIGVDVLSSTLDPKTGTLTVQLGDVTKGRVDSAKAELWQGASGVASRPALPSKGNASCQAIVCKHSSHDMVIAVRDLRATSIYGNLAPGDTCVYATAGEARSLYKAADGSAKQYTTDDNTPTGNAVQAGVSSFYQGTDGHTHPGGEWRYAAPWGGAWQDPTGYHLRTWHGVKIDAVGLVMPAPISATVSKYRLSADLITFDGSAVALGRGPARDSLVKANALQGVMTDFGVTLAAIATALGDIEKSLVTLGSPAPSVAAAVTKIGQLIITLGTVGQTTGTTTVSGV